MKVRGFLRTVGAGAVFLAVLAPRAAMGQEELVNRRDQARGAFLATPRGIYRHYCAHCHGDDATGGGRLWTSELSPSPADLMALDTEPGDLIAAIRDGSAARGKSSLCPPWGGTISATDIERLAQYITSLAEATSPQPAAEAPTEPVREPFPWLLSALVLAEIILLWWMLRAPSRKRKEVANVVSPNPSVRG